MSKEEMRLHLTTNIRSIADVETNKLNAFFMCGSPTDMPNESLINACENYLSADAGHNLTSGIIDNLVLALEKAAVVRPGLLQTGTVRTTIADIHEVLDNKEVLYAGI